MKLSVIVPIYNVEKYLPACLDSLKNQTIQDMEVFMVDDGCTDHSCTLAETYVNEQPEKFHLLHKENGGLSDARNFAIPYTTGEYIAFLDSDDWADPDYYEKMVEEMEKGNQVVVSDITYFYEDETPAWRMKGLTDWQASSVQKKALLSPMFAWNKVYRASYFREQGLRYPVHTWYEDIPVTTQIFATTSAIGYMPHVCVHYRQRSGSIMSETKTTRIQEIFGIMEQVRTNFEKLGCQSTYASELEYLHIEHLRLYGMFRFIRSSDLPALYNQADQVMTTYYPHWKKNPYLANLSFKNRFFLQHFSLKTKGFFQLFIH